MFVESVDVTHLDCRVQVRRVFRLVAGTVFVCALVSPVAPHTVPSQPNDNRSAVPPAPIPTQRPAPSRPAFRLGDAARPYGWSTAVADFNQDGTPDVAVVDRTARRTTDYSYRIEFSVSGQQADNFSFDSEQDAVTITVADIDHDNDLDVVVGAVLTGNTVGVWLNDGHGRFTSVDIHQLPGSIRAVDSLSPTTDPTGTVVCGLRPTREYETLFAVARLPHALSPLCASALRRNAPPVTFRTSASSPRAPPQLAADFSS
jgi:hypothetical protein